MLSIKMAQAIDTFGFNRGFFLLISVLAGTRHSRDTVSPEGGLKTLHFALPACMGVIT
jgi:hypothetical protein